jgi:hypothetical protein
MEIKNGMIALALLLVIGTFSLSCSKEKGGDIPETDISLAQEDAFIEALFDDIDNMTFAEAQNQDNGEMTLQSSNENVCYTVDVDHPDTTTFPKVITVDFGEGCTIVFNGDTITRSGQVNITLTDRWFMPNAKLIVTFNNFYYNGVKIEGTRTTTNLGWNDRGNLEIGVKLENGKVIFSEDLFITRTSDHLREHVLHFNSLNDTIFVTGNASGINRYGEEYNRTIIDPVVIVRCADLDYRWAIAGGKVQVINSVRGTMTIEHSGDCGSREVVIEKNGEKYTYPFRYRYHH